MEDNDTSGKPSSQNNIDPEQDGRNKEWQDRARVNLEQVPEGTKTIIERDFEPENKDDNKTGKKSPDINESPAY